MMSIAGNIRDIEIVSEQVRLCTETSSVRIQCNVKMVIAGRIFLINRAESWINDIIKDSISYLSSVSAGYCNFNILPV